MKASDLTFIKETAVALAPVGVIGRLLTVSSSACASMMS